MILCQRCASLFTGGLGRPLTRQLLSQIRAASSKKKALEKYKQRREEIYQYVGENAQKAQRVYVWGCAATGALGIRTYMRPEKGQRPIIAIGRPARNRFFDKEQIKVASVACGYGFTVYVGKAVKGKKTKLYGSGINTDSQLGFHEMPKNSGRILDFLIEPAIIPLPLDHPDRTKILQVACGRAHTLVLTDREGVFSLGNNVYGQCGRQIVEGEIFKHSKLVYRIKSLPDNIKQVRCGQDHSLFLTEAGEVYSCGLGADGQTGQGHYNSTGTPQLVKGDIEGVKIVQLGGTADCVLAVSEEGKLFVWGNSEYSQLGMVTDKTQVAVPKHLPVKNCGKIIKAVAGGSICALLNDKGQVYVWGYGILGKGPNLQSTSVPKMIPEALFGKNEMHATTGLKVTDIACGMGHFVALNSGGSVFTWGKHRHGCLGLSNPKDQYYPLKVSMGSETHLISCGVDHTVAITKSFV